jgi:hypothetical protein
VPQGDAEVETRVEGDTGTLQPAVREREVSGHSRVEGQIPGSNSKVVKFCHGKAYFKSSKVVKSGQ